MTHDPGHRSHRHHRIDPGAAAQRARGDRLGPGPRPGPGRVRSSVTASSSRSATSTTRRPCGPRWRASTPSSSPAATCPSRWTFECAVIDEAARAGVRRIVKLSARGADLGAPVAYWDWHARIEQHLQASGVPAVILQPSFLMTNLLGRRRPGPPAAACCSPRPAAARIAMIDPADVAAVAAVTLTDRRPRRPHLRAHRSGGDHLRPGGRRPVRRDRSAASATSTSRRRRLVPALVEAGLPPFAADQVVDRLRRAAARRAGPDHATPSRPSPADQPRSVRATSPGTTRQTFRRRRRTPSAPDGSVRRHRVPPLGPGRRPAER